mgnify:CR=1 FL=1
MNEVSVRDLVAAIEFTLNGMTTDQITQLLDDISSAKHEMQQNNYERNDTENLKRGLNFLRSISSLTIESRITS